MVGGVELHLVQTMPVTVEQLGLGLVLVGLEAEFHQLAAGNGAISRQIGLPPAAAFAVDGLTQNQVAAIEIQSRRWRHLIVDAVGEKTFGLTHDITL